MLLSSCVTLKAAARASPGKGRQLRSRKCVTVAEERAFDGHLREETLIVWKNGTCTCWCLFFFQRHCLQLRLEVNSDSLSLFTTSGNLLSRNVFEIPEVFKMFHFLKRIYRVLFDLVCEHIWWCLRLTPGSLLWDHFRWRTRSQMQSHG